jgi:hypothetical protein
MNGVVKNEYGNKHEIWVLNQKFVNGDSGGEIMHRNCQKCCWTIFYFYIFMNLRYVFGFLADLIRRGIFRTILVSFLPVGHTHEDIDQVSFFHIIF